MVKIGLIGDGVDRMLLQRHPLSLHKLLLLDEAGNKKAQFNKDQLDNWINQEIDPTAESYATMNTKVVSILLQYLNCYNDVELDVVQVPTYPPESAMAALTTGLEWMSEEVEPDYVHICFSTQEGKYQKNQAFWINKLSARGCKVICPSGIPPAFPASLDHVISVADRGFIDAGFGASDPDVVIDDKQVVSYENGDWAKHDMLNETASALALSRMVREKIDHQSVLNGGRPVELPDFDQLSDLKTSATEEIDEQSFPTPPTLGQKVNSYLKARLSRIIMPAGKVSRSIKKVRRTSCNGYEKGIKPCEYRIQSKKNPESFICGACGCGDGKNVLVDGEVPSFEKLDYPYLQCPASMPGFSNYLPSSEEANPSERKVVIERVFGEAELKEQTQTQLEIDKKLKKRLSWLDKFFKVP